MQRQRRKLHCGWRKYGTKKRLHFGLVYGKRCYYKCSVVHCPCKVIVDTDREMQVIDCQYTGFHLGEGHGCNSQFPCFRKTEDGSVRRYLKTPTAPFEPNTSSTYNSVDTEHQELLIPDAVTVNAKAHITTSSSTLCKQIVDIAKSSEHPHHVLMIAMQMLFKESNI